MTIGQLIDRLSEFNENIPVVFYVTSGKKEFRRTEIIAQCGISVSRRKVDDDPEITVLGLGVDLDEDQALDLSDAWY